MDKKKTIITFGSVIGLVNGLLGGGGGMLAVPLLQSSLNYENKVAHATAIAIILPVSLFASVVYLISGAFPLKEGLWTTLGVVAGGILGSVLLKKLSSKNIGKIFTVVMLISGFKLLIG